MSDDLLPPNATTLERALSGSTSRISAVPIPVRDSWNPDTCPPNMLAWLAWAFSVDQWDSTWSNAQKRAYIKASVDVHRRKGTIGAVTQALAALGVDIQVQEWFAQTPPGDPYTFALEMTVDQVGIDQPTMQTALAVVDRTKNLRSHMTEVALSVQTVASPSVAIAVGVGTEICLTNYQFLPTIVQENVICI